MKSKDFISTLTEPAKELAKATKIPASFTIAQAALESGWGNSELAWSAHNIFGIKADRSWVGEVVMMPTREFLGGEWTVVTAKWRKYPDWSACLKDHAKFLLENPRYKPAFATTKGIQFAQAVAKAGYATDPAYAGKISQIITTYGLDKLDA